MRWYNILFVVLALTASIALYQMKYDNRDLRKKVAEIEREIAREEDAVKVLRAEWSLLTQPARIETLSEKYLNLQQLSPAQIWREKNLVDLPDARAISKEDADKLQNLLEGSLTTSTINRGRP